MNDQLLVRFEEELQKISDSVGKKGGVKQEDRVYMRLGRLQQKYPTVYRCYSIAVQAIDKMQKKKKDDNEATPKRVVESVQWSKKEIISADNGCGTYFIRSSLTGVSKDLLWQFYNTIREIEATFRCLKTDLDLRPVYHKTDDNVLAHLHLGLLAYWVVNTVRHQLKREKINSSWREIVRIMNTQKVVTTTAQNVHDEIIVFAAVRKSAKGLI